MVRCSRRLPRMRSHVLPRFLTPMLALLALVPILAAAPARADVVWDHYYVLEIGGQPAGWSRDTLTLVDDVYRTARETHLRIRRGVNELSMTMTAQFEERADGTPIRIVSDQEMARQQTSVEWRFEGDQVISVAREGARSLEETLPAPTGTWFMPAAAHRYRTERANAGAKMIEMRTLDPQSGLVPIHQTMTRTGEEVVTFDGRELTAEIWSVETSAMPGVASTAQYARDGHLIADAINLQFGQMTTRRVTREAAMAAAQQAAPELFMSLFVSSNEPIPRARETRTARFRLRTKSGVMPELPSVGAQRVHATDDPGAVILEVNIDALVKAPEADLTNEHYQKASPTIDSQDALVRKLAAKARRGVSDDPMARAEAMRAFVHDHVRRKSLDTAFASASETARTRTGDCSEHGVLLCALLRADGIPARVASGLIYADQIAGQDDVFGWHMWTQALIDGRWVDFDATLPVRYDAVHVLTGTSSLSQLEPASDLGGMMMLLGNLEVDVLEVGHTKVPEAAPAS